MKKIISIVTTLALLCGITTIAETMVPAASATPKYPKVGSIDHIL